MSTVKENIKERIMKAEQTIKDIDSKRAEATPEEAVRLDREQAMAETLLKAWKSAEQIEKEQSRKPGERETLMKGIDHYVEIRDKEIIEVAEALKEKESKLAKTEAELTDATNKLNLDKVEKLTRTWEDLKKELEYIEPVIDNLREKKVFPKGVLLEEWEKIAETKRAEWEELTASIKAFKEGYMAAVNELNRLNDFMLSIRREIADIGRRDGEIVDFQSIYTQGDNVDQYVISKMDGLAVNRAFLNGLSSEPAL